MLKISARNQLRGTVTQVEKGAVNGDVSIDIGGGNMLFSNITNDAISDLDIKPGAGIIAIIKSSSILIATGETYKISARNRLNGCVEMIKTGAVNSEVLIKLPSGEKLTSIVTCETVNDLGLVKGRDCTALIKASLVILAKAV